MREVNFEWRYSSNRKIHQRAVNKVVREINNIIYNDSLWRGRFFIRQHAAYIDSYKDRSSMQLWIELRFYDHKTKKYWRVLKPSNEIIIWSGLHTSRAMNDFIVKELDVWRNEDPRADKTDYRTFSEEETIKNSTPLAPY